MPLTPLLVTNRAVAVVLPKAPFVEWINRVDPEPGTPITFEEACEEPNTFLILCDIEDP